VRKALNNKIKYCSIEIFFSNSLDFNLKLYVVPEKKKNLICKGEWNALIIDRHVECHIVILIIYNYNSNHVKIVFQIKIEPIMKCTYLKLDLKHSRCIIKAQHYILKNLTN
jgi:hypothetical protein